MPQEGYRNPKCWCEGERSVAFSPNYRRCDSCGTLFLANPLPSEHFTGTGDQGGYYSATYWTKAVVEQYGLPDLESRARADLPERNLHWLRALLQYRSPGQTVLEVGCAHGSFVALLQRAGFDALGMELSPDILEYARKTFGIPTLRGPVEDAPLPHASFDAIVAMDVLEHFSQPIDSMRLLADLLRQDGLLLIQTPCAPDANASHETLTERNDRFLAHLKEKEHIYLFTKASVKDFFARLGFPHCDYLEPVFDYDMFLLVSRHPPASILHEDMIRAMTANADRRMALALLDLDDQRRKLYEKWQESECDRRVRLRLIEGQGRSLGACEAERDWLVNEVARLNQELRTLRPFSGTGADQTGR